MYGMHPNAEIGQNTLQVSLFSFVFYANLTNLFFIE